MKDAVKAMNGRTGGAVTRFEEPILAMLARGSELTTSEIAGRSTRAPLGVLKRMESKGWVTSRKPQSMSTIWKITPAGKEQHDANKTKGKV